MIKALIFDWGGVISVEALWNWLRKNIPNIAAKKEYIQQVIDEENRGHGTQESFVRLLARESGLSEAQVTLGLKEERAVNEGMVPLVWKLKENGYKIGLLSNASAFLRGVIADAGLEGMFDQVLISSEHGMIKPERAVYEKMLAMLGVTADEVVFVDDRQKNVDGGNAAGIKSILFSGVDKLEADLKGLGVTV